MVTTSPTILGKRKRNAVCYAEPDISDFDEELEQEDSQLTDDDTAYGSRKTRSKTAKKANRSSTLANPKQKKARPQKPFPFLALPAELRDYIYELALTNDGGVTLVSATKAMRRIVRRGEIESNLSRYHHGFQADGEDPVPGQENTLIPNLLAVNKQIRAEGVAWLYQQPLILQDTLALHTFLAEIGPVNRKIVSEIVVKGWGRGRGIHKAMNVAALTALADCTNLKVFRLDCTIGWVRRPKNLARQLYRDGHYFFEQFGATKSKKDAILDVLQLSDGNHDGSGYWGYAPLNQTNGIAENKAALRAEMSKLLGC